MRVKPKGNTLKGFTLIELLLVIIILGILAALISGNFFTSLKKGRDAKRKGDLEQITRALEMYYEDKKMYPLTTSLVFGTALTDPISGKIYMQKLPNDPISAKSYEYISATGSDYKLFACLENNQQMLPYTSSGYSISCSTNCNGTPGIPCIWGVSSSNISP
jgi:type II secretion system protein G